MTFDITPYLHPDDPWIAADGLRLVSRLYDEKARIAALLQPRSIVEIGVRAGYTAAAFLAASPGASYLGFDMDSSLHGGWLGSCKWAEQMLTEKFPASQVEVRICNTQLVDSLPTGPVDVAIVDGDHTHGGCLHDLNLAAKCNPRWILVDDVTFDAGVCRAAKDFFGGGWQYVLFPTVRGDLLCQRSNWR